MKREIGIFRCTNWVEWPTCEAAYRVRETTQNLGLSTKEAKPIEIGAIRILKDNAYILKIEQHKDVGESKGRMSKYDENTNFIRRSDDMMRFDIGVVTGADTEKGVREMHSRLYQEAQNQAEGMKAFLEEEGFEVSIEDHVDIEANIRGTLEEISRSVLNK